MPGGNNIVPNVPRTGRKESAIPLPDADCTLAEPHGGKSADENLSLKGSRSDAQRNLIAGAFARACLARDQGIRVLSL